MVRFYFENFKMHLKTQLEYKASFIMSFIGQIFVYFTYYFIIIALFQRFNNIRGFNMYEVLLCFSIINFGYSFNETFFRGVDRFEDLIINGTLDRLLLRPVNVLFQVMCSLVDFSKISRILQSLIILFIALINLDLYWSISKIILLILMMISSIIIFFCIFVLMASYCFITVQGLEVKNLFTDGGKHVAQYPIGIFNKTFKFIFTFIIPYAIVNYYPILYFLEKSDNVLYYFSPLLVFIYLIPCIYAFNRGLKRYNSVGS